MREGSFRRAQPDPASLLVPREGRVPPHDLEVEGAVLGTILISPEACDRVVGALEPQHFYSDANRKIFEAVLELRNASVPADMVAVASWLRDRQRLDQVGGSTYLIQLADATPSVANIEAHARIVREKYRLRKLIATCQAVAAEGYGDCGEIQHFIDNAEQRVFEIASVQESGSIVPVKEAITAAFQILSEAGMRGGAITGIETGFSELDRKTAGLHAGDLYIVAGRPGMGKTAFVLNLAVNVARSHEAQAAGGGGETPQEQPGHAVAFFSLEMPKEQLAARLLASEAHVDVSRIRSGDMRRDDWNRLTEAAGQLGRLPLWLDDAPALSLLELRGKIRRLQAQLASNAHGPKKLGLVAIDYLQLMQGRRDAGSREQEISELSRGLKQLAKEMKVAVLALSQLNRSVETRGTKDKRPQLSDLRESGAIEQDADTIMFIYRDEYYFQDSPDKGKAEIIIAKQRNGPTGKVMTKYTSEYTRFDNLSREEYSFDEFDDFAVG